MSLWSLILVRPQLPEDTVLRLATAMHKGEVELARRLEQGRYTTIRNTAIVSAGAAVQKNHARPALLSGRVAGLRSTRTGVTAARA